MKKQSRRMLSIRSLSHGRSVLEELGSQNSTKGFYLDLNESQQRKARIRNSASRRAGDRGESTRGGYASALQSFNNFSHSKAATSFDKTKQKQYRRKLPPSTSNSKKFQSKKKSAEIYYKSPPGRNSSRKNLLAELNEAEP